MTEDKYYFEKEKFSLPEFKFSFIFDKELLREILNQIKLTRELLHKVFGAFTSQKLLSPKNKNEEWILRKHLSTMERLSYYTKVYERIFFKEVIKCIILQ